MDSGNRLRPDPDTLGLVTTNPHLAADEFSSGFQVADFRIIEIIGRGGSSTIYTAENCTDGRVVALKVLKRGLASSPRQVQRLIQEAQAVQRIRHPGIADIYDIGNLEDGRPYLVMELIDGISLDELLTMRGRLPPDEAIEIMVPICGALEQIHKAGIVHRDVKARNIMLVLGDDEQRDVKLLDFGIAKLLNADAKDAIHTSAGVVIGSLHAIAPEQIQKKPIDGRTDVYALGVLLYKILTGYHPFRSSNDVALLQMHLNADPPAVSNAAPVPTQVDAVIAKAMAKEPAHRHPDASSFLAALQAAVHDSSQAVQHQSDAWAIYVLGSYPEGLQMDDDLLGDLVEIVDIAAYELQEAGLQVMFQTDQSLLAVAGADSDDTRSRLFALAIRLYELLLQRAHADERVQLLICIHRDKAATRELGRETEITGGSIVDVEGWAPGPRSPGLYATRAATDQPDDSSDEFISLLTMAAPPSNPHEK